MRSWRRVALLLTLWGCAPQAAWPVEVATREVDLRTGDEVGLRGTLFTHDQPGPGILLVHQCMDGSDRRTWAARAQELAQRGYHVLTFDLRGYGESSGEWPSFATMPEFIDVCRRVVSRDVAAAYQFLKSQPHVDRSSLGVGGASCGVFLGIDLAYEHDDVRTLVLLSGPFDALAERRLRTRDAVPLLIAASEKDARAFEAMKRVFAASGHPGTTFVQLKGDRHGTFMFESDLDFGGILVRWFERWLPLPEARAER